MISVGIIGGTGYTGKHLVKFCSNHQQVAEMNIYANSTAGEFLHDIFPEFSGVIDNDRIQSADQLSYDHDLYFVSLPHGSSLDIINDLISKGKKVIDLGGDFRLNNPELYNEWYGFEHRYKELLNKKHYGLADLYNINGYHLISNPGCYPTAALLSLLPVVCSYSSKIASVSVNSYSGSSGAGKSPKQHLLLSELYSNVKAYNVGKHRHQPEIQQELARCEYEGPFSFVTHLFPVDVGIYSTSIVHLKESVPEEEIRQTYYENYLGKIFVRLRNVPPELKWVIGTNFCDINITVNGSIIIITAAIDNLIKGASGQAVQNMNMMFGFKPSEGLITESQLEKLELKLGEG